MLMKVTKFLSIMAAALMLSLSFNSCEELDGLFDDDNEAADNQAFFPKAYKGKAVEAWYSMSEEEKGGGKRIEAVFLFDDNTFVLPRTGLIRMTVKTNVP